MTYPEHKMNTNPKVRLLFAVPKVIRHDVKQIIVKLVKFYVYVD